MLRSLILATAIATAVWVAGSASAAVIYDNGAPNQETFWYADADWIYTIRAEPFTLNAGASTIGGVNWWGGCTGTANSCPAGNFTLYFYTDSGGTPGSEITSASVGNANQTATGALIEGTTVEYSYSTSVPDLTLAAGTEFWLGISNSTSPPYTWGWETSGPGSNKGYSGGWTQTQIDNLAFNLTSPVPEPGSLFLLGSGLMAIAVVRRRRKSDREG